MAAFTLGHQPDPSPGGSANSYAYTHGNPVNETDLSGAWSLNETSGGLSAVGSGEGIQVEGGTGIAAGAIMPLPVNAQIEAAFQASPPWDQFTAGTEEYEEYEEEWEEEGEEYEYASYKHEGSDREQQGNIETGLIYQSLEGMTEDQAAATARVASLCEVELGQHPKVVSYGGCTRLVDILGIGKAYKELWHTVKHSWGYHAIRKIVHVAVKIWHSTVVSTGREVFGIGKCAYELVKQYGAGCGNP